MAILRVIEPFADFSQDPNGRLYTEGMLVDDSDPAAGRHPHRFERVETAAFRATETAVSAPGLRRALSKPEKRTRRAAKKSAAKPAAKKTAAKRAPAKKAAGAPADPPKDDTSSEVL